MPPESGESRRGRVSRLARQSESATSGVPYTRPDTSSIVSEGKATVKADRGMPAGLDCKVRLRTAFTEVDRRSTPDNAP
jgi:hypothetical protein